MPDTTVNLQVIKKPANAQGWPGAGFTLSQNNADYAYKYTGGNWPASEGGGPGCFKFTSASGDKSIDISMSNSANFLISKVMVTYDGENEPVDIPNWNADGSQNPASTVTLTDSDVDAESGRFDVFVNDTANSVTGIECDPRWQNT